MSKKLLASLLAACASLVAASSALAAPSGEFSVFAQCPTGNSSASGCIYAQTEAGEFVVGKKKVPITKAITLQGGIQVEDAETGEAKLIAASNGETLSKASQNVPGGLAGLVNCTEISNFVERLLCEATLESGVTGVTATTELAAPASSVKLNVSDLLFEHGTALKLPVKVHLENPFLGSECYVGSNSSPVELELTTGATSPSPPNTSIKGTLGELSAGGEGSIAIFHKNSLVDNSFAAPGVSGCGGLLSFLIDPIVNDELGTPSAAGHNTAILTGTLEQAGVGAVVEHS